jgi:hypothetical protein
LVFVSLKLHGWLSLAVLGIVYLLAVSFFAVIHFRNRKVSHPAAIKSNDSKNSH